ncbi:MAG: PQQ-binding-like beta-propeller repeat protein [Deltaproteobacteria bacterium]|nr:PQQ-binding-like beta-propeller repeat protein [Deltaproteobacteria bacterium]
MSGSRALQRSRRRRAPRPGLPALALACAWVACGLARAETGFYPYTERIRPGDWPMARRDAENSAYTRIRTEPPAPARAWSYELDRLAWEYQPGMAVWSSAAVGQVGERAVLAAGCYDRGVYLLDAASGERLWRYTTGGGVFGAPLIWRDGGRACVFAASSDRAVYALDAETGERIWSRAVEPYSASLGAARLSAPCLGLVAGEPAVFVGHWVADRSLAHSRQRGGLSALRARSGEMLWRADFLDHRVSDPVFARLDGRGLVFAASEDGNLRALDADTGAIVWVHRETERIMGSPAVTRSPSGARVLVGSHFGKLRCLDARTGLEAWSYKTGNWLTGAPAVLHGGKGDLIVFGGYDQKMVGLDLESGQRRWTHSALGPVYSAPSFVPRNADPVVIFSAWDHQMYGLSGDDGTGLWTFYTGRPIWDGLVLGDSNWASPVAAEINGRWMIYFGSYDGTFYAIPLSQASLGEGSPPWSGLRFWITMAGALGFVLVVSLLLTRRRRAG